MSRETPIRQRYDEIFEAQGVPEEFRSPDDFHMYRVSRIDSEAHAGEIYAIPKEIYIEGELYDLLENGTVIHKKAEVPEPHRIGNRAIVYLGAVVTSSDIGPRCIIGNNTIVNDSILMRAVTTGGYSDIIDTSVGDDTTIGSNTAIVRANIGADVNIGDSVQVGTYSRIGSGTNVKSQTHIQENVLVSEFVEIEEDCRLLTGSQIGIDSRLMRGVKVKKGKKIKPASIVFPDKYRRGYRSNIANQG